MRVIASFGLGRCICFSVVRYAMGMEDGMRLALNGRWRWIPLLLA